MNWWLWAWGCRPGPPVGKAIVLVSWDTTRADALGAYGNPQAATPNADLLAARGVRFSWALAHAPTTLNSHATLFTGLDPHGHGVVRNGYALADDVPLLQESFAGAGWDTVAVVGATPLDASMGLGRGFRLYDDLDTQAGVYEHNATKVTERVSVALETAGDRLFLFVHYYDPHTPWDSANAAMQQRHLGEYTGPMDGSQDAISTLGRDLLQGKATPGDRRAARDLYLAEVSWVDHHLDDLLLNLDKHGYTDQLVALVSDHGEALDDRGTHPYSHGPDVDLVATHVPLIIWGKGAYQLPGGTLVDQPVGLMDVANTLAGFAQVPEVGAGQNLAGLWSGASVPSVPLFAEATKPLSREEKTGWNNLPFERSVIHDGHMLIRSAWSGQAPMVFALAQGQPQVDDAQRLQDLESRLSNWDQGAPPYREGTVDPAVVEGLRALGYMQ